MLLAIIWVRTLCAVLPTIFLSLAFFVEVSYIEVNLSLRKRQDEFAFAVIHDLRSSLSTLTLASELLTKSALGEDRERIGKLARLIRSGATSMNRLISDLALQGPLEVGQLALQKDRRDLRSVVGDFIERMSATTEGHALNAVLPGVPVWVDADAMRLEQLLTNLLSNARKYSYPGTPIDLELRVEGSRTVLSVTNRGAGIEKDDIPRLFSRYFRTESGRERAAGFGLGLFIVKGIVEAHHGEVFVKSTPGEREATSWSSSTRTRCCRCSCATRD